MTDQEFDDLSLLKVPRLSRALKDEAAQLGEQEARYLVDGYYAMQKPRVRMSNQLSAGDRGTDTPMFPVLARLHSHTESIEGHIRGLLQAFAEARPVGQWMLSLYGVGPVLSAGILAHFDIREAHRPSAFWRYAGLDPTVEWLGPEQAKAFVADVLGRKSGDIAESDIAMVALPLKRKPEKLLHLFDVLGKDGEPLPMTVGSLVKVVSVRPWNQTAKVLTWKLADCMVRFAGREECYYGHRYLEFKEREVMRNEAGNFAGQAHRIMQEKPNHKQVATYREGRLPDGHVDMRARRRVSKLFLLHLWLVWWELEFGEKPPIGHLDVDGTGATPEDKAGPPPNWPM